MRMGEADALEDIARLRAAPEYTMQAVVQRTGVPPDTLRSWERRYGFPEPSRTDANRRLFSDRDIAAIAWLRDQTERGQGTSEAVNMLLARLGGHDEEPTVPARVEPPMPRIGRDIPAGELIAALAHGDFRAAQRAWDRLALAASVESLCIDVLLPADQALRQTLPVSPARRRAAAFLLRKAAVLLDHAGPDRDAPAVALIAEEDERLRATALAVLLARTEWSVITPLGDLSLDTLALVRSATPARTILVVPADGAIDRIAAFTAACAGIPIAAWCPEGASVNIAGVEALPADPLETLAALTPERHR